MSKQVLREEFIALVDGDLELVELLVSCELITERATGFSAQDVDRLLVARTLLRELDVNIAGLEVILRLREELAAARRRLRELDDAE